jgi:hypothetical protein
LCDPQIFANLKRNRGHYKAISNNPSYIEAGELFVN